jgi:glycosyltransferase involved in cell wall biosynthesis
MNMNQQAASDRAPGMAQRVLFATTVHHLPEMVGGVELTTHELGLALIERGCTAAVLSRTRRMSRFAWRARANRVLGRPPVSRDRTLGYTTYRARDPLSVLPAVCNEFAPTVAIVQNGRLVPLAQALVTLGIPTIMFIYAQSFSEMGGDFFQSPLLRYATASQFMASILEARLGTRPYVIPPLVKPERYAVESSREVVTFVNPVPLKGLEVALHLARQRPDVSFEFVETWPIRRRERNALVATLATLPNVRLLPRHTDMRPVYARSRLLLVPSREEAWGRVVSEAQLNGIPVLASDVGGLPESVGPGGMLVQPYDRPQAWDQPFAALWDDPENYRRHSAAALAHARRPSIQFEHVVSNVVAVAEDAQQSARR